MNSIYSPAQPSHPPSHSTIKLLPHSLTHSLDQEDGQEVLIKFGAVTPVLVRLDSKSGLRPSLAVPAPVPAQTPGTAPIILQSCHVLSTLLSTIVATGRISVKNPCRYM